MRHSKVLGKGREGALCPVMPQVSPGTLNVSVSGRGLAAFFGGKLVPRDYLVQLLTDIKKNYPKVINKAKSMHCFLKLFWSIVQPAHQRIFFLISRGMCFC